MSNEEYWSIHEMGEALTRNYTILEQAKYSPYSDIQDINRRIRTLICFYRRLYHRLIDVLDAKQKQGRLIVGGKRNVRH